MAVFLSPLAVILQYFSDQGIILSGGKIFIYEAGGNTPVDTFTDVTGAVANSNPIILDEAGRLQGGSIWQTGGQAIKAIFTDANGVPIGKPLDQITGINDTTSLEPLINQLVNQAVANQDTQFFTNLINNTLATTITQSYLGSLLYPQNAAEIAANVTPLVLTTPNGPLRYGAKGDGVNDDSAAWNLLGKVNGIHNVPDGTYLFKKGVGLYIFTSIHGWTRQNTVLQSAGNLAPPASGLFGGITLIVGIVPGGPNPNVGLLERLKFIGAAGDTCCLYMNVGSHMWHLNELLFQSSPCVGMVVSSCEDANYTNIDMLSVGGSSGGQLPSNASLLVYNGSNNIYFRGLRIEQGPAGCMYFSSASAIFIDTGKCDQGFIAQSAPTISIDLNSQISIDNYTIQGANGQYPILNSGSLTLGNVVFEGGTNTISHIRDTRAWDLVNGTNPRFPGVSLVTWGPYIPTLDLGKSTFYKYHPSVSNVTSGAVYSNQTIRIPVGNSPYLFSIVSSVTQAGNCLVGTTIPISFNSQYNNCYLVHNATGTKAVPGDTGSRRLILQCFVGGNILVEGPWGCTADGDWSLEYSGGHCTQIQATDVDLQNGIPLFSPVASSLAGYNSGVTITSTVGYSGGQTVYAITTNNGIATGTDLTGLYLIDDVTGEPYLITSGLNSSNQIGVAYDTTGNSDPSYVLNTAHPFSIYAGYYSGVKVSGDNYVWDFAGVRKRCPISIATSMGFNANNIPLWGCGIPEHGLINLTDSTNFSSTLTAPFIYQVNGSNVTLTMQAGNGVTGNSTTNQFTLSGLPSYLTPKWWQFVPIVGLVNGGQGSVTGAALVKSNGQIQFYISVVGSSVTNGYQQFATSGTKGISPSTAISYSIN